MYESENIGVLQPIDNDTLQQKLAAWFINKTPIRNHVVEKLRYTGIPLASTTFPHRIPKLSLRYPPKRTNGHFRWTNGQIWRPPRPGTWRSRFLSHWGVNKFDTSDCAGIGRLIG